MDPAGPPELVVAGRMFDDFCIDEDAGVLNVTTHRQNTIDRVAMDPGDNSGSTQSVAGDPFTEALIGPSSEHGAANPEMTARRRISSVTVAPRPRRRVVHSLPSCSG